MLWSPVNSGILGSVNGSGVGIQSTHAAEDVKQVFNVGKRIDQFVHDSGKRVLQRVVVDRGEVKVHRYVTKVVVVKFL